MCTFVCTWLLVACSISTPSPTQPASPSATPTIRPSVTPKTSTVGGADTAQAGWQVPTTDAYDPGAKYRLVPIGVDSLLAIFYGLSKVESVVIADYAVYEGYYDEDQIHQILGYKLDPYGDPELSPALSLIEQMAEEDEIYFIWNQDERRIFTAGFLAALNQENPDMSAPGTVSVFDYEAILLDLDHDDETEWLADVQIPGLKKQYGLPIDQDAEGNYALMPHDPHLFDWSGLDDVDSYDYSRDVNGDGLPDLVLFERGNSTKMRIYVWNDESLQGLSFRPELAWLQEITIDDYKEFTFDDLDGDGVTELRIGEWDSTASLNWEMCDYQVDVLEWQGIEVTSTRIEGQYPSQEPECLASGVLFQEPQPIPDRQPLERIAAGLEPEDWEEHPDWYALVYIKLAAVQWLNGEGHKAQWTIAPIWQYRGENAAVSLWRELWESSEGDFLAFCRSVNREYQQTDGLAFSFSDRLYHIGGRFNETLSAIPMGELFCPSTTLTRKLLSETIFPLSLAPEAGLAQVGIPVLFAETVDLDDDPDLEWIGVVDGGGLIWAYWDATEAGWQGFDLAALNDGDFRTATLDTFEFCLRDVSGDGIDDLISLRQLSGDRFGSQKDPVMFLAVYDFEADELLLDVSVGIDDLSEVDRDLVDELIDGIRLEQLYPPMGLPPYYIKLDGEYEALEYYLRDSLDELITDGDPAAIRAGLEQALAQIPEDGINADVAIRQIQYLIGYSFELEGDGEGAISAYRQLIEAAPDSYWSWLAWACMAE